VGRERNPAPKKIQHRPGSGSTRLRYDSIRPMPAGRNVKDDVCSLVRPHWLIRGLLSVYHQIGGLAIRQFVMPTQSNR
jgi:hypothetical protein